MASTRQNGRVPTRSAGRQKKISSVGVHWIRTLQAIWIVWLETNQKLFNFSKRQLGWFKDSHELQCLFWPAARSAGGEKWWRAGRWAGFFALSGILAGCQTAPLHVSIFRRDYQPDNVFVYPPKLALNLQRVAVLPLAAENSACDLPEGCDALSPVLWEQLVKTKKFEVVAVDADKLRSRTGRANWTGAENLPPDFLAFLRREYGCDAVLFAELTAYRAYAPLAVGWRLKLVDARSGQILWSADELFDAAHPARLPRGATV